MQIHEITSRRQLNEVDLAGPGGLWTGIKNAAKTVKTMGLGGAVKSLKPGLTSTSGLARSDFAKNMQALKTNTAFDQVSKNLQQDWEQRRSAQLGVAAKSGQPMTQQALDALIDDWYETKVIPADLQSHKTEFVNPTGGPAPGKIVSSLQHIKAAEKLPDAQRHQAQATEIKNLIVATSAMSQLLAQQNPALGRGIASSRPKAASTQSAQAALQKAPINMQPTTIAAVQQVMGQLPAVTSRDPDTKNYLKALGFNVT